MAIPFMSLSRQIAPIRAAIDAAIDDCIEHTAFIQGARVRSFEEAFAKTCGATYAVGCGSGTDALYLALAALGIGPGDEVILPAMTFIATVEAVEMVSARPVLVDVDPVTSNLDLAAVESSITARTAAVIPVHLYGRPVDLEALRRLTVPRGIKIIGDAAQAHLATWSGKPIASYADVTCFSFYPGKNLGAFGDAGACVTDDEAVARNMSMRRNHGRETKYEHLFSGVNMRMDEIQAAVLSVKLRHLAAWTERRRILARRYHAGLQGIAALEPPPLGPGDEPVWHLYVVQVERRDELAAHLRDRQIGCGIHYPIPLHRQPAYARPEAYPVAEDRAAHILSLPLFEAMTDDECDAVIEAVRAFYR